MLLFKRVNYGGICSGLTNNNSALDSVIIGKLNKILGKGSKKIALAYLKHCFHLLT